MPANDQVIGVGHPLALTFDEPVADKAAAERAIRIDTEPHAEGAFHWFNDKELRWRPKEFWKPGTRITINASIYGKNLGDGVYGDADQRVTATVGDALIARADGASHEMTVEINGRVVRTIPISLGKPSFPSNNGIHVVSEMAESTVMDSTTFGLSYAAGGYRTTVQWATRISNGGEYVHAAPWSVGQQGYSNVSHGCINMSTEAARWFFHTAKRGDVVIVTNTGGPDLQPWDGWGDWQMPWQEWIRGVPR
jgi:lipoprotein-anchoring transpeptidase ErfK/SrfK